jgi:hypothetical protein
VRGTEDPAEPAALPCHVFHIAPGSQWKGRGDSGEFGNLPALF